MRSRPKQQSRTTGAPRQLSLSQATSQRQISSRMRIPGIHPNNPVFNTSLQKLTYHLPRTTTAGTGTYISPSDTILSPASKKLAELRSKQSSKQYVKPSKRGSKFRNAINRIFTKQADSENEVVVRAGGDGEECEDDEGGFRRRDGGVHSLAERRSWFGRIVRTRSRCVCGTRMERTGCPVYGREPKGER